MKKNIKNGDLKGRDCDTVSLIEIKSNSLQGNRRITIPYNLNNKVYFYRTKSFYLFRQHFRMVLFLIQTNSLCYSLLILILI